MRRQSTGADSMIAIIEPVETHFLWRPQLRDPADELVLEAAAKGRASAIVSFNAGDFGTVPPEIWYRRLESGRCITEDQTMGKSQSTYPLRLPTSVKAEVVRRAKADGTSFNQFVATAVAEKLAAMNTAAFFLERRERADFAAFDKMKRKGGERPMPEDVIPRRNGHWSAVRFA
jgi:hypothetical protein